VVAALARDLGRDVGRVRAYAQARHLKLDTTLTRDSVLVLTLDQADERYLAPALIRYFVAALRLAHRLAHAIDGTLARHLDLRLGFSRDEDLEPACELAAGLESDLVRTHALTEPLVLALQPNVNVNRAREQILDIDRSISRTLALALVRSRALDRVCAQGMAGRLGVSLTEGLAEELLDGAMDDFTSADLTHASLANADLTGVRWSLLEPSGPLRPTSRRS
jgi:hypothetical protein